MQWREDDWTYDVFVSHAGEDKEFALMLRETFKEIGLRAFVDEADLEGGAAADLRMLRAVKEAPVGLALMSKPFFRKAWPMRELGIIVGAATLLPVLYMISHEEAKEALSVSPLGNAADPDAWKEFVNGVMRTTALRNPSTGTGRLPFRQLIVFSAVGLCVSTVGSRANVANKVPVYKYAKRLEAAASQITKNFGKLTNDEARKARHWSSEMGIFADSL